MEISEFYRWKDACFSDVGRVRDVNEDHYLAMPEIGHWVVADGMGGHDAGDVASRAITKALSEVDRNVEFEQFVDEVEDQLIEVNQSLIEMAGGDDKLIGSTVAGLAICQTHVLYYWAGDSRCYLFRHGRLKQLSVDHTYIQELIEQGKLEPEQADEHQNKNMITRAVGADNELFIDMEMLPLQPGDIFFLCSDGVEKEMTDKEVENVLKQQQDDIETAGKVILDTVLSRGGRDNVTFILVSIQPR